MSGCAVIDDTQFELRVNGKAYMYHKQIPKEAIRDVLLFMGQRHLKYQSLDGIKETVFSLLQQFQESEAVLLNISLNKRINNFVNYLSRADDRNKAYHLVYNFCLTLDDLAIISRY